MPTAACPTIVIPGITASFLHDIYPLPPETVWSVVTKDYARATLHPNNLRYEAVEPARVVPGQIFEIAYRELIEELRHNLRTTEDLPVPVYPFAYDWRQPLDTTERQLEAFIDEVIARTLLLQHYRDPAYVKNPKVNLVGHSMGGLIIAGYLQRVGASRVHKVATLATPFQGSFEAVIKVTTGTADLGGSPPSSRERESARLTPALYQLIPSFANGLEITDPTLPKSLFDPAIWQPSIIDTIQQYIRLHGLTDLPVDARELFASLLKMAATHRHRTDRLKLPKAGLDPKNWLCVVGAGSETRVKLKVEKTPNGPNFIFSSADRQNEWENPNQQARRMTGDGTVPFEGALPKFLKLENLVVVTSEDYGYWEIQDRAISKVAGFHGILPNMDMLHRLIVAHFTDRPDTHGNIWGRTAPGVTQANWAPPIPGLRYRPPVDP